MKLNNKGFAISTVMYMILIMAVILITLTLSILSGRKLILDSETKEAKNNIYNVYDISYRQALEILKNEAVAYAQDNNIEKDSIKIGDFNSSIDNKILDGYKLTEKYLTIISTGDSYNIYLGKSKTITDISKTVNNLIDIVDYKISGNSYQETYTGKNLVNKDDFENYGTMRKYIDIYLEAGTYYYSSNLHSESGVTFYTAIINSDTYDPSSSEFVVRFSVFAGTEDEGGFTINESGIYRFLIYCSDANIFASLENVWDNIWIQIEKGTVASGYEPYVGGEPSPNPEYPQDVQSVGEKTKNLLNPMELYKRYSNDEVIINNNKITINTPKQGGTKWFWWYVPVEKGKTYTVSRNDEGVIIHYKFVTEKTINYNYDVVVAGFSSSTAQEFTVTSEIDGYLSLILGLPVEESSLYLENLQVEEGTEATPYEPYGYKIPLTVSGKNLLDNANWSHSTWSNRIYLKAGQTYTFSFKEKNDFTKYRLRIQYYDKFGNLFTNNTGSQIANSRDYFTTTPYSSYINNNASYWQIAADVTDEITITPNDDCSISILFLYGDTTSNSLFIEPQFELGNATSYEPYYEPVTHNIILDEPLRKIGSDADYIDFNGKKLVRYVGTKELDGVTNGKMLKSYSRGGYIAIPDMKVVAAGKGIGFSSFAQATSVLVSEGIAFGWENTNVYFCYINGLTDYTQINALINELYLVGVDTNIYYQLASPKETSIDLPKLDIGIGNYKIEIGTNIKPSSVEFTVIQKIKQI